MPSVVQYQPSDGEARRFGPFFMQPGDEQVFDADTLAAIGRPDHDPDAEAELFVHVYTDGGRKSYLTLHHVNQDGTTGKRPQAVSTDAPHIAALFEGSGAGRIPDEAGRVVAGVPQSTETTSIAAGAALEA